MLFDLFLHLDFGNGTFAVVEFGFQAGEGFRDFACSVDLTGFLFALSFVVVKTTAMPADCFCKRFSCESGVCGIPSMYSFCGIAVRKNWMCRRRSSKFGRGSTENPAPFAFVSP
jgi:hypothetical protein